ncbi:hypothetical protein [Brevibacterium sediminis]
MRKPLITSLAVLTLLLSACGASSEPAETDAQPVADTEESGATAEQFASLISEERRAVDEWLEDWDDNTCSTLSVADGDPLCEVSLTSGSLVADTAKIVMEGATKEGVPAYIGQPPEEIASIWQETFDAATAASEAGEAIPDDCSTSDDCVGKVMDFTMAMDDLQGKYDAWAPYL